MKRTLASVATALTLVACATNPGKVESVDGQPDIARFKIYTMLGVPESEADRRVLPQFDAYRQANGYRSYAVVDRTWNYAPTYFEYTVRFQR